METTERVETPECMSWAPGHILTRTDAGGRHQFAIVDKVDMQKGIITLISTGNESREISLAYAAKTNWRIYEPRD